MSASTRRLGDATTNIGEAKGYRLVSRTLTGLLHPAMLGLEPTAE
ncbi:MAG: hypothetical protein ACRDUX_09740 [Mycobacterium sp.]